MAPGPCSAVVACLALIPCFPAKVLQPHGRIMRGQTVPSFVTRVGNQRFLECDRQLVDRRLWVRKNIGRPGLSSRSKPPRYREDQPLVDQLPRFSLGNISMPVTIINAESILSSLEPEEGSEVLYHMATLGFTAFEFAAPSFAEEAGRKKLDTLRLLRTRWQRENLHFLREILLIPTLDAKIYNSMTKSEVQMTYFYLPLKYLKMPSYALVQMGCIDWRGKKKAFDALANMNELSNKGYIEHIGAVNLDFKILGKALNEGISVRSNRIPYSLIDRRPEAKLIPLAKQHSVSLILENPLAEGWISEKWVGKRRPDHLDLCQLSEKEKMTYELVRKAGGWVYVQSIANIAKQILDKYVDILSGYPVKYDAVPYNWAIESLRRQGVEVGAVYQADAENNDPLALHLIRLDMDDMKMLDDIAQESFRKVSYAMS
ncbi:hypothetical protein AAMO2058_000606300 [Amorphochlora amoebiformis]